MLIGRASQLVNEVIDVQILLREEAIFFRVQKSLMIHLVLSCANFEPRASLTMPSVIARIVLRPILVPLQNFVNCDQFDGVFETERLRCQVVRYVIIDKVGGDRVINSAVPVIMPPAIPT